MGPHGQTYVQRPPNMPQYVVSWHPALLQAEQSKEPRMSQGGGGGAGPRGPGVGTGVGVDVGVGVGTGVGVDDGVGVGTGVGDGLVTTLQDPTHHIPCNALHPTVHADPTALPQGDMTLWG